MNDLTKVRNALREHQPSPYSPYDPDGCGECTDYEAWPEHAAHAVVAALAPRRVETAEELDALPEDTIVADSDGNAWQIGECISGVPTWREAGSSGHWTSDNVSLPATVLWTPEGEQ